MIRDPVEAFAPQRADPALGIGVGVRGSDRRPDDRDAFATEDLIEAAAEFAVAVVEQEAEGLPALGELHQQVPGLLRDPAPSGFFVLAMNSIRRRSSET